MPVRLFVTFVVLLPLSQVTADDPRPLTFEDDIRPIFREHCYDCHGATDEFKGGLDLRLVRLMQLGGESGEAIVAGEPGESYLVDRLRSGEMPPGATTVSDAEIQIIENWIAEGARTARPEPDTLPSGLGITPEERAFWSFQPIHRPDVPDQATIPDDARVRSPIDALVWQTFSPGQAFAPDADRRTLIKRAFLDLTGLPPSPEETQTWAEDTAADWYDRLLTDLLSSPHYGERWGRHWLDVAGYADSEGYTNKDAERPWAWKYRDWVIQALNDGMPFDTFVTQQLAGDELAGPRDGDLTEEQIALLTATGFLRMAADGTGSGSNDAVARNQVMTDTLKIVGTSLLGLSIQCAQCHDHRYDPIPQSDYYALRAVFEPAIDWQAWKTPNARRVSLYTTADREKAAEIEAETTGIAAEKSTRLAAYMKQALDAELMNFAEPVRAQLRLAYETTAKQRTEEQKKLLTQNPSVNITAGNLYQYIAKSKPELAKFDKQIGEIRARKPVEQFLHALVEPANHAPETKLFFRGDHQQPKQTIGPAGLTVAAPPGKRQEFSSKSTTLPTTGRRLEFAKWLTNGRHPLVARVIVNRIWLHHFGTGLVATPSDLGKLGVRPSHPELLDWLADEFMRQGWSLKTLHRQIMLSTVWRQSAEAVHDSVSGSIAQAFTRRRLVRLDAESLRDRMLTASGQLNRKSFGPPIEIKQDDSGQVIVNGDQHRRSMYIKVRRSQPVAMMQAFDAPVMQTNCELRQSSTAATQSLMLLNGEFILGQAAHLAQRAAAEAVPVDDAVLQSLPRFPPSPMSPWSYGYGEFDVDTNRVKTFTNLSHWSGSQWQAGNAVPDPDLGYVLLHANGGHPDAASRAVIRRWTAPTDGSVTVSGKLSHGSENGNGVRGRVVSSRSGKAGEWMAFHQEIDTTTQVIDVVSGDTIDFVTDANGGHTSDSFNWPVTLTLKSAGQPDQTISSVKSFSGPVESRNVLAGQIIRAWELALCREPNAEELRLALDFLANQRMALRDKSIALPASRTPSRQALVSICQALFSSNEFLYVE
jgi:Protein of unknown function (DUF1553)/Protein of unknown function (DUF1549)/Planctomycete cytochrome C